LILFFLLNIFENFIFPEFALDIPQSNPASIFDSKFHIRLGGEEKFSLEDLRILSADLNARPIKLRFKTFGNELYRENSIEFQGGFLIYKTLCGGLGLEILNNWIKDYKNEFTYSIKLGSAFYLPSVKIEVCLNNINSPKFSEVDYLPMSYFLGLNPSVNPVFKPYIYIMGKEGNIPFFRPGLFINFSREFELYSGLSTENFLFEYGLKVNLGKINISYSGISHRQLGLTNALFVIISGE
jgi:hypothetical protein